MEIRHGMYHVHTGVTHSGVVPVFTEAGLRELVPADQQGAPFSVLTGIAPVLVEGDQELTLCDPTLVYVRDSASVVVHGTEHTVVYAEDNSSVTMHGEGRLFLSGTAFGQVYDKVRYTAMGDSQVAAHNSTSGTATDSATVAVCDTATGRGDAETTFYVSDYASAELDGLAQAYLSIGAARYQAGDGAASVKARGTSSVIVVDDPMRVLNQEYSSMGPLIDAFDQVRIWIEESLQGQEGLFRVWLHSPAIRVVYGMPGGPADQDPDPQPFTMPNPAGQDDAAESTARAAATAGAGSVPPIHEMPVPPAPEAPDPAASGEDPSASRQPVVDDSQPFDSAPAVVAPAVEAPVPPVFAPAPPAPTVPAQPAPSAGFAPPTVPAATQAAAPVVDASWLDDIAVSTPAPAATPTAPLGGGASGLSAAATPPGVPVVGRIVDPQQGRGAPIFGDNWRPVQRVVNDGAAV